MTVQGEKPQGCRRGGARRQRKQCSGPRKQRCFSWSPRACEPVVEAVALGALDRAGREAPTEGRVLDNHHPEKG